MDDLEKALAEQGQVGAWPGVPGSCSEGRAVCHPQRVPRGVALGAAGLLG